MIKSLAKATLRATARRLPWGAQEMLLQTAVDRLGKAVVFRDLARSLSINSATATGINGTFSGTPEDISVFGRYMQTKVWAPELIELIRGFFDARGGTFLDIGANIGLTVVPVARCPGVKCYAFEPEPNNLSFLRDNLIQNGVAETVSVLPIALFDRKATLKFAVSKQNSGDNRIWTDGDGAYNEATWPTTEVQADRLDAVLDATALATPLAVKIDTQGAEPKIFAGGGAVLSRADLIVTEFCPYMMRRLGGDLAAEINFLSEHFREGSIARGDTNTTPSWQPIGGIVSTLRRIAEDEAIGIAYFDVAVRK